MSLSLKSAEKFGWHYALLIAIPLLLMWGIFFLSPNFDFSNTDTVNPIPLGGDYLQEYVGGQFINDSALRDGLYDSETFKKQQHQPDAIGFEWDQRLYFPLRLSAAMVRRGQPAFAFKLPIGSLPLGGVDDHLPHRLLGIALSIHRRAAAAAIDLVPVNACDP